MMLMMIKDDTIYPRPLPKLSGVVYSGPKLQASALRSVGSVTRRRAGRACRGRGAGGGGSRRGPARARRSRQSLGGARPAHGRYGHGHARSTCLLARAGRVTLVTPRVTQCHRVWTINHHVPSDPNRSASLRILFWLLCYANAAFIGTW